MFSGTVKETVKTVPIVSLKMHIFGMPRTDKCVKEKRQKKINLKTNRNEN